MTIWQPMACLGMKPMAHSRHLEAGSRWSRVPALSLHVQQDLSFSAFMVDLVAQRADHGVPALTVLDRESRRRNYPIHLFPF
jgi:hypothetical protein